MKKAPRNQNKYANEKECIKCSVELDRIAPQRGATKKEEKTHSVPYQTVRRASGIRHKTVPFPIYLVRGRKKKVKKKKANYKLPLRLILL